MKIAYFNCTAAQAHIGCLAVTDAHFRVLLGQGYDITSITTTAESAALRADTREQTIDNVAASELMQRIEACDAVVVNGEGTIHHQRGGELLSITHLAKQQGKRAFIVNAVVQEMDGWLDLLSEVDDLNVRDPKSAAYLKEHDVPHRLVLDTFLEASFADEVTQDFAGKHIVTDWHPARDHDVGQAALRYLDEHNDAQFYPFHHWMHIEQDGWCHSVANLATADLIITGRHHGLYAALLTGRPFVALPSNTHKIEGTVEFCDGKIPFCDNMQDLEKQATYATNNPNLFLELKDFIQSHRPLATFDALYEALPTGSTRSDEEVRALMQPLKAELYKKAQLEALRQSYNENRDRTRGKEKQSILRDRLDGANKKIADVKASYVSKIDGLKDKIAKNKEVFIEKNELLKAKMQEQKQLFESRRYNELAKASFAAKDYKNAHEYAHKGLSTKPYDAALINFLFKSENLLTIQHVAHRPYASEHIAALEKHDDSPEKHAALAKAYGFGSDYGRAIHFYRLLKQQAALDDEQEKDYAMCLQASGEFEEAKTIYESIIANYDGDERRVLVPVVRWLLLTYCQIGEYDNAIALYAEMQTRLDNYGANLWPIYIAYLGKEDLKAAWDNYLFTSEQQDYDTHFNGSLKEFEELLAGKRSEQSLFIMPSGGIGDEIRHATLYKDLEERMPHDVSKVTVCCDPRLETLLSRSFPAVNFYPTSRRNVQALEDTKINVPENLAKSFNDNSFAEAKQADITLHCYSMMKYFRNSFDAFEKAKTQTIIADPKLRKQWRKKLDAMGPNLKVGINKGTHLSGGNREVNIFRFDGWGEVFAEQGVDFINLSLDMTKKDIAAINKQFNTTNIHYLDDIDLMNDIESLAALIAELDVVVTPPNMMTDLAGGLGTTTFCMYTTALHDWRFSGKNHADVWHSNAYGLASDIRGKKDGVMTKVAKQLRQLKK